MTTKIEQSSTKPAIGEGRRCQTPADAVLGRQAATPRGARLSRPAHRAVYAGDSGGIGPDVDWSDWPDRCERGGLLFHGDNKEVLAHLLASGFRGKVDLVYFDPPFDSGADYVRRVQPRGASSTARLDGESHPVHPAR